MASTDYFGIFFNIVQYAILIVGIIQIVSYVFSLLGLDRNKYFMKIRLFFRKIRLSRKEFEISVAKSFDIKKTENINNFIIEFIDDKFKEYNPNSQEKSNSKIETRINRYNFDITLFIHINPDDDEKYWININQRSKVKFKDISNYLNTTFYNFQLFNFIEFNATTNNVDVTINIEGIEMFEVLFENVGETIIGNISLIKNGDKASMVKVSGVPQIEIIPKVEKIIEFGSL
ncbi:MAG: hypothetical protein ACRCVG_08100 [Methanobacteriaceae archaeon]